MLTYLLSTFWSHFWLKIKRNYKYFQKLSVQSKSYNEIIWNKNRRKIITNITANPISFTLCFFIKLSSFVISISSCFFLFLFLG